MRLYILPTIVLTILSTAVFVFTVIYTNPKDAQGNLIVINLIYFFTSAFVGLAGALTLVLYSLSNLRSKETRLTPIEALHKPKILFRKSMRHAILISGTITSIGLLNSLDFASSLNIILLITAAILIEIYLFGH